MTITVWQLSEWRTIEELVNSIPKGYQWLLRSDKDLGYFAHVHSDSYCFEKNWTGRTFKAFDETPSGALRKAVNALKTHPEPDANIMVAP